MSCLSHKPQWIVLVEQRIQQLGSIQKVADELGYARPSLSLALRGKYIGNTDRLEKTVIRVLGAVHCPHLEQELSPDAIVTDPPYFKVKTDSWDHQWSNENTFFEWLDTVAQELARVLKPNGTCRPKRNI